MNILLILADEHRADALGCAGHRLLRTPHLDGLAAAGSRHTRHSCSSPICTPARASLMTGLYPRSHGAVTVGHRLRRQATHPFDNGHPCLGDYLAGAGYRSGIFGKSHLEAERSGFADDLPPDQPYYGFDTHALCEDAPFGPYWRWLEQQHPEHLAEARKQLNEEYQDLPWDQVGRNPALRPVDIPVELSMSHWITDRSIDFIADQAAAGTPFCCVCSFVDPHHPWSPVGPYASMYDPAAIPPPAIAANDPPSPHATPYTHIPDLPLEEYQRTIAAYYGMISHIDHNVGRLLAALDAAGVADDTLVVYTADHGEYNGDRALIRKGPSLMGSLLTTPMIMRHPRSSVPGRVVPDLSQHEDLLPTLLAAAGIPRPEGLPGHDLTPCLVRGAASGRSHSFFMHHVAAGQRQCWGISDGRHKLSYTAAGPWLVDEAADPLEYHNRIDDPALAPTRQALQNALLDWLISTPEDHPGREEKW